MSKFSKLVVSVLMFVIVSFSMVACSPASSIKSSAKGSTFTASYILSNDTASFNVFSYLRCVQQHNTFSAITTCGKGKQMNEIIAYSSVLVLMIISWIVIVVTMPEPAWLDTLKRTHRSDNQRIIASCRFIIILKQVVLPKESISCLTKPFVSCSCCSQSSSSP